MKNSMQIMLIWAAGAFGMQACTDAPEKQESGDLKQGDTALHPVEALTYKWDSLFNSFYQITDLRSFSDTNVYIAQIRYYPPFTTGSVISLMRSGPYFGLVCIKQLNVRFHPHSAEKYIGNTFNQICVPEKKDPFLDSLLFLYETGKRSKDIECSGCYHPTSVIIEIVNKGTYSRSERDYLHRDDSVLIFSLMKAAGLDSSNNFELGKAMEKN